MRTILAALLGLLLLSACRFDGGSSHDAGLDEQIGQMLVIGFRGMQVDEYSPIVEDIRERHIGGVVLFDYDVELKVYDRNIASPEQLSALVGQLQAADPDKLLVMVDQEGGYVARLKERYGFPPSQSQQDLAALEDLEATYAAGRTTAGTLRAMGINLNLAPVVDLNANPDSPAIGRWERSFSADPQVVTTQASALIDAHHAEGVLTTLKHFPGHGSAGADSHLGLTDVTQTWSETELEPFAALIDNGRADVVMTAHIYHADLDPEDPATLSAPIINGLLRGRLGWDGPVISDDMQMGAITQYYGLESAIEKAILAGVDLLMFANNSVYEPDIAERAIAIIRKLVDEGRVSRERIRESYERIQVLKGRIG